MSEAVDAAMKAARKEGKWRRDALRSALTNSVTVIRADPLETAAYEAGLADGRASGFAEGRRQGLEEAAEACSARCYVVGHSAIGNLCSEAIRCADTVRALMKESKA